MATTSTTKKTTAKAETKDTIKSYSQAELDSIVAEAVKKAVASMTIPTSVKLESDEYVTLLLADEMAPESVFVWKELQISHSYGEGRIDKKTFITQRDYKLDKLLRKRVLVVVDGLTDEERERFGVNYTEDELLTPTLYYKLFDLSEEEICRIFKAVCPEHKKVIARMYIDAYNRKDNRVNPHTVKRLNTISKKTDADGLFTSVISAMSDDLKNEEVED